MHTDPLFYRLFQERPATLFELAGVPFASDAGYRLTAVEVKQTAFRLDGVMMPRGSTHPLVFCETQFQADPLFYARWAASIFLFLYREQILQPWLAVVVYPQRSTEHPITPAQAPLEQANVLRRVYLGDLLTSAPSTIGTRLARLVVLDNASAAREARALAAEPLERTERIALLDLIETVLVYKFPQLAREEIRIMLQLPDTDLKQTRFYQEVFREGQQEGRREGQREGRREGQREGRREGRREALRATAMNLIRATSLHDAAIAEVTGLEIDVVTALRQSASAE